MSEVRNLAPHLKYVDGIRGRCAALAFSHALIACSPGLQHKGGNVWDNALPVFQPAILLSHVFLDHNFAPAWFMRIDPPIWSIDKPFLRRRDSKAPVAPSVYGVAVTEP